MFVLLLFGPKVVQLAHIWAQPLVLKIVGLLKYCLKIRHVVSSGTFLAKKMK